MTGLMQRVTSLKMSAYRWEQHVFIDNHVAGQNGTDTRQDS